MENKNKTTTKLPLAMKFAIAGSVIAVLGALISFFIALLLKKEYTATGQNKEDVAMFLSSTIVYSFLGIVWTCIFAGLAPLMKRIKSKAIPINFIVFASLGIVFWLFGLAIPVALDIYLSGVGEYPYAAVMNIDPVFNQLRQLVTIGIIPGVITILGWVLMLVAGIIATTAKKEELVANKNLK